MFIELTDLLRCPNDHPEAYLVLLPERMDGRQVVAGHLGCPACGWGISWTGEVPDLGGGWRSTSAPPFDAAGAVALLGLQGPGGWVALAGAAAALLDDLRGLLPGVHLVAINPPAGVVAAHDASVVLSAVWPLKSHALRGAVLGPDAGAWRDAALASVLPGLRLVGGGEPPARVELLGSSPGLWVARK